MSTARWTRTTNSRQSVEQFDVGVNMPLNPSHVPRLVYDFLSKTGCQKAAEKYADECPYLTGLKYFTETSGNKTLPPMMGPSLLDIVNKFFSTQDESLQKCCEKTNSAKGSKCACLESEGKVLSTTLMPETAAPQPNTRKPSMLNVETQTHQSNIVIVDRPIPPIAIPASLGGNVENNIQKKDSEFFSSMINQPILGLKCILPKNEHSVISNPIEAISNTKTLLGSVSQMKDASSAVLPHPILVLPENTTSLSTDICNVNSSIRKQPYVSKVVNLTQQAQPVSIIPTQEGLCSTEEKNNRPVHPIAPTPSKLSNQAPTTLREFFRLGSPSNSSMIEFLKKLDPILPIPANRLLLVSEALAHDPDIPLELISILTEDYLGPRTPTGTVWMTTVGAGTECWTFISVLLHLSKQPGCEASASVRVLVEGLLHGIINISEFVTDLQRLFNVQRISRSLIPFLTASIPHLWQFLITKKISIDGIKYSPLNRVSREASVSTPVSTMEQFSGLLITEPQGSLPSVQSVRPLQRSTDPIPIGTIPLTPQAIEKSKKPSQIQPSHPILSNIPPKRALLNVENSKTKRDVPLLIALKALAQQIIPSQHQIQTPVTNQLNLTGISGPSLSENGNLSRESSNLSLLENNKNISSISPNISSTTAPVVIRMSSEEARLKCFQYLSSILCLSHKQPKKVHHSVRTLVQRLVNDEIEPETFIEKIVAVPIITYSDFNLLPFLKAALPHFRRALYSNELTLEGITPPPYRLVSVPTAQSLLSAPKKTPAAETQVQRGTMVGTQDSNQKQKELKSSEHESAQVIGSPIPFTPNKCIPGASESITPSETECAPDSVCGPNEGITSSNDSVESGTLASTSDSSTEFLPKLLALKRIASNMLGNSRNTKPCHSPPPTKRNRTETRPCSVVLRRTFDLRMPEGTFSISM